MRLYETAFVLDPQQKSEEIEEQIKKVTSFITNHGGEVTGTDEWGKKRLAYEINKKQYGYYSFIRFTGPGQLVSLLEREYRLSESVLRYLTLKIEKHQMAQEDVGGQADEDNSESQKTTSPNTEPKEKPATESLVSAEEAKTEASSEETPEPEEQEKEASDISNS